MKSKSVFFLFAIMFLAALAFTGCPAVSPSGGATGPTHALTENAALFVCLGDAFGRNPDLNKFLSAQVAGNPLSGEGDENVVVLEKGTKVQDRGVMHMQYVSPDGNVETIKIRYIAVSYPDGKEQKGYICDTFLSPLDSQ